MRIHTTAQLLELLDHVVTRSARGDRTARSAADFWTAILTREGTRWPRIFRTSVSSTGTTGGCSATSVAPACWTSDAATGLRPRLRLGMLPSRSPAPTPNVRGSHPAGGMSFLLSDLETIFGRTLAPVELRPVREGGRSPSERTASTRARSDGQRYDPACRSGRATGVAGFARAADAGGGHGRTTQASSDSASRTSAETRSTAILSDPVVDPADPSAAVERVEKASGATARARPRSGSTPSRS